MSEHFVYRDLREPDQSAEVERLRARDRVLQDEAAELTNFVRNGQAQVEQLRARLQEAEEALSLAQGLAFCNLDAPGRIPADMYRIEQTARAYFAKWGER